jgi:acetyl esterase
MPLDPHARMFLDRLVAVPDPSADATAEPTAGARSPETARAAHVRTSGWAVAPGEQVAAVHSVTAPGPRGGVPLRVYAPERPDGGVLLYLHGGGWVVGTLDTFDGVCRSLANRCATTVVAVDYALAPEHPYPAALDDCLAVARWVADGGVAGGTAPRHLVVVGDSAGGNLAAALAIRARDGGGPRIDAQVLVYPITDATMTSDSYSRFGEGFYLTEADMRWYWQLYLGDRNGQVEAEFSPVHAQDLSGLPPALVITAEYDPLRDEGEAYARRLAEAGTTARLVRFDGAIHGFFRFTAVGDSAVKGHDVVAEFLRSQVSR